MAEFTSPLATTAARVGMRFRPRFLLHGLGDLDDAELERTAREYVSWAHGAGSPPEVPAGAP